MQAMLRIDGRAGMSVEEWLKWRKLGIGSSDASAIMGVSPWATPFEKLLEKTGRINGRVRSAWEWKAMRRGIRLEPEARAACERWVGTELPARAVVHPRYPQIRTTLDGIDRFGESFVSEFKVPGKKDHLVALSGRIPEKYIWQCRHHSLVTGLPCLYWSYRNGDGVGIWLPRDEFEEAKLRRAELAFWNAVVTDTWPIRPSNVIPLFQGGRQ